jgi:hypothetical protein
LKRQVTPARSPCASTRKVGPVSRVQLSSCCIGRTAMPGPHRSEAWASWSGRQIIVTGSNRAIACATSA